MKKCFLLLMVLTLIAGVFISCSAEEGLTEELVYVKFADDAERDLSSAVSAVDEAGAIQPVVDLYWFYTATKTADKNGTVGVTTAETRVNEGTGLDGTIGPFSPGEWTFKLFAYQSVNATSGAGETQIYKGEATVTLSRGSEPKKITVTIENSTTTGTIVINDMTFYNADNAPLYFNAELLSDAKTNQNEPVLGYTTGDPAALTAIAVADDTKFVVGTEEKTAQKGTYYYNVPVLLGGVSRAEDATSITIGDVPVGQYTFKYAFTDSDGDSVYSGTVPFTVYPGGTSTIGGGVYDFDALQTVSFEETVVDGVAQIAGSDRKFATLKDAIAAAKKDDVINVIGSDSANIDITIDKVITLNMNGNTYGGTLTIAANGIIVNGDAKMIGQKALYNGALYLSLEDAIKALPTEYSPEEVIKLLVDLNYESKLSLLKAFTLDLNGKALTSTVNGEYGFFIDGDVTIIDSSEGAKGIIAAPNCTVAAVQTGSGSQTINAGTFNTGAAFFCLTNYSQVTINGGTFVGAENSIYSTIDTSCALKLCGGTYDKDPSSSNCVAVGYIVRAVDGVYKVIVKPDDIVTLTRKNGTGSTDYYYFQDAVDAAVAGDTITALEALWEIENLSDLIVNVDKAISIDLLGYSFDGTFNIKADGVRINSYGVNVTGAAAKLLDFDEIKKYQSDGEGNTINYEYIIGKLDTTTKSSDNITDVFDRLYYMSSWFVYYTTLDKAYAAINPSESVLIDYMDIVGEVTYETSFAPTRPLAIMFDRYSKLTFTSASDPAFTVSEDLYLLGNYSSVVVAENVLFQTSGSKSPSPKIYCSLGLLMSKTAKVFDGAEPYADCLNILSGYYNFNPQDYLYEGVGFLPLSLNEDYKEYLEEEYGINIDFDLLYHADSQCTLVEISSNYVDKYKIYFAYGNKSETFDRMGFNENLLFTSEKDWDYYFDYNDELNLNLAAGKGYKVTIATISEGSVTSTKDYTFTIYNSYAYLKDSAGNRKFKVQYNGSDAKGDTTLFTEVKKYYGTMYYGTTFEGRKFVLVPGNY